MKLSSKSEYACLALVDLTERYGLGLSTIAGIAERKNIPKKFLEQILLVLKRAGYVKSRKGAEGGYRLNKPPRQISVAEIVRLMDGALAPVESVSKYFYEPTPIEQCKPLVSIFRNIRDYIARKLETTTFADLAGSKRTRRAS
ncbi:MAG: Rrf2 family transcriptional regulator [Chitinivibrionales bacterium]|nr:Rrf2 family transcriptional regulator [Chitinivibrionales bacterium]MBD3394996.1 Rrf2 family transcriptional regulator [Chitinivibrionales bacterium]